LADDTPGMTDGDCTGDGDQDGADKLKSPYNTAKVGTVAMSIRGGAWKPCD